jgi:hypothetical protein
VRECREKTSIILGVCEAGVEEGRRRMREGCCEEEVAELFEGKWKIVGNFLIN